MEVKFKRSFLGYSPKSVERAINAIIGEFEKQLRDLEEQNTQGEYDVQSLKNELKEFKDSMTNYQALEEELTKLLVSAHFSACGKIIEALNLASQMEKRALNKVLESEKEAGNLKKTMDDITKEVKSLTKRYSLALEGSDE